MLMHIKLFLFLLPEVINCYEKNSSRLIYSSYFIFFARTKLYTAELFSMASQ
jgi:hypothetical protein